MRQPPPQVTVMPVGHNAALSTVQGLMQSAPTLASATSATTKLVHRALGLHSLGFHALLRPNLGRPALDFYDLVATAISVTMFWPLNVPPPRLGRGSNASGKSCDLVILVDTLPP